MKDLCYKCNSIAVWKYDPSSNRLDKFFCDDHIDRGCSCQEIHFSIEGEEKDYTQYKDDQGRLLPCVEYSYCEYGFENGWTDENDNNFDSIDDGDTYQFHHENDEDYD